MIGNDILEINWTYSSRLKKSIRFKKTFKQITISAPEQFSDLSEDVRKDLEKFAELRLKKSVIDPHLRKRVRSYFDLYFDSKPVKRQFYQDNRYHSLPDYFDELNSQYFNSQCLVKSIGWSHQSSKRLMGKYCDVSSSIVISSYLNSSKIPANVVKFIVYHEMCHQQYPPRKNEHRRSVHHREFRKNEAAFSDYTVVKKWFKTHGFII